MLKVTAHGSDGWKFQVAINGVDVTQNGVDFTTVSGGQHEWGKMDTDQFDSMQTWNIKSNY